jgi:hypothetical protein
MKWKIIIKVCKDGFYLDNPPDTKNDLSNTSDLIIYIGNCKKCGEGVKKCDVGKQIECIDEKN